MAAEVTEITEIINNAAEYGLSNDTLLILSNLNQLGNSDKSPVIY